MGRYCMWSLNLSDSCFQSSKHSHSQWKSVNWRPFVFIYVTKTQSAGHSLRRALHISSVANILQRKQKWWQFSIGGMYWEIHNWGPRDAKQFYQFLNQNISIKFLSISMGNCTVEDLLLWGPAPVCPLLHSCHYCHFLQPYLRARSQNLGHKLSTAKSQIVNGEIAGPV